MSDDLPPADTAPASGTTAGALLRQAREATGLHIGALAVAMKVPVKKLEALEADRLDDLHDAVFVRALAASMCRALKIDPAPVLNLLPQTATPKFERDDRGINMPYSAPGLLAGHSLKGLLSKPAVLLVAALLLGALAVTLFPESVTVDRVAPAPAVAPAPLAAVPASAPAAVASAVSTPQTAPAAPASPAASAVAQQAVASVATSPASAPVAPVAATPSASDLVVFKAKDSAWVRVSDSKGVVQFEKTLAAGESAGTSGALPLSVVVGNVGATEMLVRGKPFNLEEVAKNNVARFEVK
ncbi:MAG: helix-turn-helix domain-containing protein [Rhodoferax sp.]|nr:helix-turn-helix domain-containing protein [Rhodoferax sp.]